MKSFWVKDADRKIRCEVFNFCMVIFAAVWAVYGRP